MTIKVLSDAALLVVGDHAPGAESLAWVQQAVDCIRSSRDLATVEVVPAATSFAVHLPVGVKVSESKRMIAQLLAETEMNSIPSVEPRVRVIPVRYGEEFGPDLRRVARAVGFSPEAVIERHLAGEYTVLAVGFAPGFPYLSGLDPVLHCPRLETPRTRVPAGSVGIGGEQTGVYPQELPGGWNLIGRTHQPLFDPLAAEPSWLRVGDQVRFELADALTPFEFRADQCHSIGSTPPGEVAGIEVVHPGVQTTVQDLGRTGFQTEGVTVGGAVNTRGLQVANVLVGNEPGAAALEFALRGPRLRFHERRLAVVTGTMVAGVPFARPFMVEAGEELDLRKLPGGGRGIVAVSGGFAVESILGSKSTHLAGRFGGWQGRALKAGDLLPLLPARAKAVSSGWWISPVWVGGASEAVSTVRIMRGPEVDVWGESGWQTLLAGTYDIQSDSNRMGMRLRGPELKRVTPIDMISQPIALGTIQVPRDGQPIILLADRQTLGGYPRIASVIAVDIAVLAQAPLGGKVRFEEIGLIEAEELREEEARDLGLMAAAVKPRLIPNA